MNINLLSTLPTNWSELTLKQYNKLITANLIQNENDDDETLSEIDYQLMVIATLLDVQIEDLEALSINQILPVLDSIKWIYTPVQPVKTSLKCKDISELTYAEFIQYMQLQSDPFNNTSMLLPIFFDDLKDVDVNQLPITQVAGFFLKLQVKLKRHLRHSQYCLVKKIIKMKVMKWLKMGKEKI